MTDNANLYDFINVDDLPEDLRGKLHRETKDSARAYAEIVCGAPRPLNISEIVAVATRKFGADNVPGYQTVRGYLNTALENGLISKPSRQFYAAPGVTNDEDEGEAEAPVEQTEETAEEKPARRSRKAKAEDAAPAEQTAEDDPLADL